MSNNKILARIILVIIILLFFTLVFFLALISTHTDNNNINNLSGSKKVKDRISNLTYNANKVEEPKNIKQVIEFYNSKYISQVSNVLYVEFDRDLYDDEGKSNEKYFENLTNDLKKFFEPYSFLLIDDSQSIEIEMKFQEETEEYAMLINKIEDYYDKTNGNSYSKVKTSIIKDGVHMQDMDHFMLTLTYNSYYFSSIKKELGEGEDLGNKYTSYLNGKVRLRIAPTGAVRNIIFNKDYKEQLTAKINNKMNLREIAEAEPDYTFGSMEEGYLGYRGAEYYLFFYRDETSIYTYSYKANITFEEILEDYLEDKDLDKFQRTIKRKWQVYDIFRYDEEKQNLYILCSNRGVEINIKENNPKGIKLYGNYYFTDKTRQYVKDGIISFSTKDLLEKSEIERRNNPKYYVD